MTWPLLATWSSRPPDRPAEGRAVRCPESPLEELSAAHRPFFECAGCVVEWGATHEVRPRVAALERQQPPRRGRRTHVSCVLCAPEAASSTHVSPSRWPRTPSVCTHTHTHMGGGGRLSQSISKLLQGTAPCQTIPYQWAVTVYCIIPSLFPARRHPDGEETSGCPTTAVYFGQLKVRRKTLFPAKCWCEPCQLGSP